MAIEEKSCNDKLRAVKTTITPYVRKTVALVVFSVVAYSRFRQSEEADPALSRAWNDENNEVKDDRAGVITPTKRRSKEESARQMNSDTEDKILGLLHTGSTGRQKSVKQIGKQEIRIVGGTPVADGSIYPFYVDSNAPTLCGATLIHEDILLTAAHCLGGFLNGASIGGVSSLSMRLFFVAALSSLKYFRFSDSTYTSWFVAT